MDLQKDKYIIVEIIPTHSNSEKGFIAQISALKLEGIKLIERFDYRVKDNLIENEDIKRIHLQGLRASLQAHPGTQ